MTTRNLADSTSLPDILADYATKASPALTGTPTAPTATGGTNTTQIATTAFVASAVAGAGGAPTDAKYLTTAANGTLSAEVVIPGMAGSPDISGSAGAGTSEEYDSATTGLTWSPSDPDTVNSNTTILSHLYIKSTDGTERFGTKAWAPSGAFDARAKLSIGLRDTSSNADIGLVVADSGLSNFALLQLNGNGSTQLYRVFAYSYASGFTQRGGTWTIGSTEIYARISRDGSNNVSWWWSSDGKVWQLVSTTSFTFTPAKIGFRVSASASVTHDMAVDWLRTDS